MEVILTNSIIATLLEELKEPEGYDTHSCEILQRMNTQQDCCYCLVTKVCLTPCDHLDYSMPGSFFCGISQARTQVGCHSFTRDLPDPRLNMHLLHCRRILVTAIIELGFQRKQAQARRKKLFGRVWVNPTTDFLCALQRGDKAYSFLHQWNIHFCTGKSVWDSESKVLLGAGHIDTLPIHSYQNSRFPEGMQSTINRIACTHSLYRAVQRFDHFTECFKAKFPETSQGPALQTSPSKDQPCH